MRFVDTMVINRRTTWCFEHESAFVFIEHTHSKTTRKRRGLPFFSITITSSRFLSDASFRVMGSTGTNNEDFGAAKRVAADMIAGFRLPCASNAKRKAAKR